MKTGASRISVARRMRSSHEAADGQRYLAGRFGFLDLTSHLRPGLSVAKWTSWSRSHNMAHSRLHLLFTGRFRGKRRRLVVYFSNGGTISDFHTYGVIWSPNEAQFIETTLALHISPSITQRHSWRLGLQPSVLSHHELAMAVTSQVHKQHDAEPAVMTVDYVRIYRRWHDLVAGPVSVNAAAGIPREVSSQTPISWAAEPCQRKLR